jgi:hypothetical protein
MPATSPAEQLPESDQPHERFKSVDEIDLHGSYWAYVRYHVRQVRVVSKARTRVHVAFFIAYGTAVQFVQIQPVPFYAVHRNPPRPESPVYRRRPGLLLKWPAPTVEEAAAAVERIR